MEFRFRPDGSPKSVTFVKDSVVRGLKFYFDQRGELAEVACYNTLAVLPTWTKTKGQSLPPCPV